MVLGTNTFTDTSNSSNSNNKSKYEQGFSSNNPFLNTNPEFSNAKNVIVIPSNNTEPITSSGSSRRRSSSKDNDIVNTPVSKNVGGLSTIDSASPISQDQKDRTINGTVYINSPVQRLNAAYSQGNSGDVIRASREFVNAGYTGTINRPEYNTIPTDLAGNPVSMRQGEIDTRSYLKQFEGTTFTKNGLGFSQNPSQVATKISQNPFGKTDVTFASGETRQYQNEGSFGQDNFVPLTSNYNYDPYKQVMSNKPLSFSEIQSQSKNISLSQEYKTAYANKQYGGAIALGSIYGASQVGLGVLESPKLAFEFFSGYNFASKKMGVPIVSGAIDTFKSFKYLPKQFLSDPIGTPSRIGGNLLGFKVIGKFTKISGFDNIVGEASARVGRTGYNWKQGSMPNLKDFYNVKYGVEQYKGLEFGGFMSKSNVIDIEKPPITDLTIYDRVYVRPSSKNFKGFSEYKNDVFVPSGLKVSRGGMNIYNSNSIIVSRTKLSSDYVSPLQLTKDSNFIDLVSLSDAYNQGYRSPTVFEGISRSDVMRKPMDYSYVSINDAKLFKKSIPFNDQLVKVPSRDYFKSLRRNKNNRQPSEYKLPLLEGISKSSVMSKSKSIDYSYVSKFDSLGNTKSYKNADPFNDLLVKIPSKDYFKSLRRDKSIRSNTLLDFNLPKTKSVNLPKSKNIDYSYVAKFDNLGNMKTYKSSIPFSDSLVKVPSKDYFKSLRREKGLRSDSVINLNKLSKSYLPIKLLTNKPTKSINYRFIDKKDSLGNLKPYNSAVPFNNELVKVPENNYLKLLRRDKSLRSEPIFNLNKLGKNYLPSKISSMKKSSKVIDYSFISKEQAKSFKTIIPFNDQLVKVPTKDYLKSLRRDKKLRSDFLDIGKLLEDRKIFVKDNFKMTFLDLPKTKPTSFKFIDVKPPKPTKTSKLEFSSKNGQVLLLKPPKTKKVLKVKLVRKTVDYKQSYPSNQYYSLPAQEMSNLAIYGESGMPSSASLPQYRFNPSQNVNFGFGKMQYSGINVMNINKQQFKVDPIFKQSSKSFSLLKPIQDSKIMQQSIPIQKISPIQDQRVSSIQRLDFSPIQQLDFKQDIKQDIMPMYQSRQIYQTKLRLIELPKLEYPPLVPKFRDDSKKKKSKKSKDSFNFFGKPSKSNVYILPDLASVSSTEAKNFSKGLNFYEARTPKATKKVVALSTNAFKGYGGFVPTEEMRKTMRY